MTRSDRAAVFLRRKPGGFTILEILIAVSLVGVILAALYSTFFLADRALSASDERLRALQEVRLLLDAMRREVESSCLNSRDYTVFKVEDRDYYGRQASRIEFTSFAGPVPGLTRTRYSVEERAGALVLRKRVSSAYQDPSRAEPEVLLEDVQSFAVEVRSNGQWVRTWDSGLNRALPGEVRLSLGVAQGPDTGTEGSRKTVVFSETALPKVGAARR